MRFTCKPLNVFHDDIFPLKMDKIIKIHLVMYILNPDAAVSLSIRSEMIEEKRTWTGIRKMVKINS